MIDKYGEIVVANHSYYEVFGLEEKVENKDYNDFIDDKIKQLILEAFKTEKACIIKLKLISIMYIINILMFLACQFCQNLKTFARYGSCFT